jgi:hypothetical protein
LIELCTEVPRLLKVGDCVRFVHEEEKYSPTFKANRFYEIKKTLQVPYDFSLILPEQDRTLIKLQDIGLEPSNPNTMYEILIGFGGSNEIEIYPKIPSTDYHLKLEKAPYEPNPSLEQLRFLGGYSKEVTSIDEPKLLIYIVKDFEEVAFEVFNCGSEYGKLIIHTIVNICHLEETDKKPTVWKDILHYKMMR